MSEADPQSVFCVIDRQYCDRAVACDVRAGRFQLAGSARQLGTTPSWLDGDFPTDDEWRIELSKFYFGLDLAHARAETGDDGYLACWVRLVRSWIEQVPTDHDPTDVAARRIQNWTYAWNRFGAGAVAGEVADEIRSSVAAQIDHIRTNLATERNHRTLELYALFVCALAHPTLDPSEELARWAAFELYRNLRSDVLPDGVHRERSTHYHAIALRSYLGTRVNARWFGIDLPPDYDERLASACTFLATVVRPDGSLPQLSDSDDGDYRDLLLLASDELSRPDLRWVATQGKEGAAPSCRSAAFTAGGYYVQRSGWGDGQVSYESERQLILDCGPVGDSGHGHYDALHIEVSAGGQPLLVDPGRFSYAEDADGGDDGRNWRHWFKGTAAHNTVSIDRLDQVPYRRGKQKGPTSHAQLLERAETDGVVSLVGEVVSPCYDAIHRRRILFVAGQWWIVEDILQAATPHHYDLRFHLSPTAQGRVTLTPTGLVTAPGLQLLTADPSQVPTIEQGWVAPGYGQRSPAPVVSIATDGIDTRFLTVLLPTSDDDTAPSIGSWGPTDLELRRGSRVDRVTWGSAQLGWQQWRR